jgi:hypothetical protein
LELFERNHCLASFCDLSASSAVLSARKLKFWLQALFDPTWCTSIQNFEILKNLKNSGGKKFKSFLKTFKKC